jgi:hypothetical protein
VSGPAMVVMIPVVSTLRIRPLYEI